MAPSCSRITPCSKTSTARPACPSRKPSRAAQAPSRSVAATGWHTLEVQAAYTPTAGMFNTEMNTDSHPDIYGGASRLNQLDLKAVWRFAPH